jgi:hypothetical protein
MLGMVERGDRAGFALEAFGKALAGGLDGDVAAQARVVGAIDDAHTSGADYRDDFIGADSRPDGKAHVRDYLSGPTSRGCTFAAGSGSEPSFCRSACFMP